MGCPLVEMFFKENKDSDYPDHEELNNWAADKMAELEKYKTEMDRKFILTIYNRGYKVGHNHTVEGWYTDIHHSEMDSYHEDDFDEITDGLL